MAAGGGSMLFFRSGMFVVGPESAGANPGPACYCKGEECIACDSHMISLLISFCVFVGGPLTITDANLCLQRLLPE